MIKKVFAHYFTWFAVREISGRWCHWNWEGRIPRNPDNIKNGRGDIASVYTPLIGPYDSSDLSVQRQHIELAMDAGIDFFTVDWYGPEEDAQNYRNRIVDANFKSLLKTAGEMDFSLTVCYEEKLLFNNNSISSDRERVLTGKKHIKRIKKYFENKSYYTMNGRPLLIIWGDHTIKPEMLADILSEIRDVNPVILYSYYDKNFTGIVSGFYPWVYIDSQANIEKNIRRDYDELKKAYKDGKIEYFAGSVWPDFDDTGVQAWDMEPARKCPEPEGLYDLTWKLAVESASPLISINTFNDWNESTSIEPGKERGDELIKLTKKYINNYKK